MRKNIPTTLDDIEDFYKGDENIEDDMEEGDEFLYAKSWNIIRCRKCREYFDMLKTKFDGDGNIICPKCGFRN